MDHPQLDRRPGMGDANDQQGPFRWDRWYQQARAARVDDALAQLGRAVIRDYDQHGKAEQQDWCASWGAPQDSAGMLALAQCAPLSAEYRWATTLLLDSDTADAEAEALRVMARGRFGDAAPAALDRLIAALDDEEATARAVLEAHGVTPALWRR